MASLFWTDDLSGQKVAEAVRLLSLISTAGVIWLEFAVFGDLSGRLLGVSLSARAVIVVMVALLVFLFTFSYGLRGFVLADLLHSPLIGLAVLLLLGGALWQVWQQDTPSIEWTQLGKPFLDQSACVLFTIHVIAVNSFWVLVSESHWLRMWLFAAKEIKFQLRSQLVTAALWALLIIIGFAAHHVSGGKVGVDAVGGLLQELSKDAYVFVAAFWIGGTAALFSTADAQIYCFRLVQSFDTKTGGIPAETVAVKHPGIYAVILASLCGGLYYLTRLLELPFEKLVFALVPSVLNVLPPLLQLASRQKVTLTPIVISVLGYVTLTIIGLYQPASSVVASLAAALVPIGVGLILLVPPVFASRTK